MLAVVPAVNASAVAVPSCMRCCLVGWVHLCARGIVCVERASLYSCVCAAQLVLQQSLRMVFIQLWERLQSMAPDFPDLLPAGHIGQWDDYYLQPPNHVPPCVCASVVCWADGVCTNAEGTQTPRHSDVPPVRFDSRPTKQESGNPLVCKPPLFVDIYMAQCFHAVLSMRVAALCVTNVRGGAMQAA